MGLEALESGRRQALLLSGLLAFLAAASFLAALLWEEGRPLFLLASLFFALSYAPWAFYKAQAKRGPGLLPGGGHGISATSPRGPLPGGGPSSGSSPLPTATRPRTWWRGR